MHESRWTIGVHLQVPICVTLWNRFFHTNDFVLSCAIVSCKNKPNVFMALIWGSVQVNEWSCGVAAQLFFLFSTPCLGNKEREGSSASRQRHLRLPDTCCRVARQTCERWLLCNRNMEQEIPIRTTLCSYPFSPPGTARSSSKLTQHSGQEAPICHDMNHLVMSRSICGQSNYNNCVVYLIILGFSHILI